MEIIVLDNASSDGTQEMVRNEFPSVRLIALDTNTGTSARNRFRDIARGKYLFNYDDDSMPATPATLATIVQYMESHTDVDALFPFYFQPITGYIESDEVAGAYAGSLEEGYRGIYSVEGGACYRLSSFRKVKGYDERLIWGSEGVELSIQMYRAGLVMVLHEGFATLHLRSHINRVNARNAFLRTRHLIWLLFKHWPTPLAYGLAIGYLLRRSIGVVKHPTTEIHSVRAALIAIMRNFPFRSEKPKMTFAQVKGLKKWYLRFFRW
jgi:GT2 family glycosyltransferase